MAAALGGVTVILSTWCFELTVGDRVGIDITFVNTEWITTLETQKAGLEHTFDHSKTVSKACDVSSKNGIRAHVRMESCSIGI